tara:strand:- start:9842 stop:10069 length:228 start_codon:yes stop_codon:yes gene_type:complete
MTTEYNIQYGALINDGNGGSREVGGVIPAQDMDLVALGVAFAYSPSDVYVTDGKEERRYSLSPNIPDPTGYPIPK